MKDISYFINEQLTKSDLNAVEKMADKIFAQVGIDIEFTKHFLDRVNDARNGKPITAEELSKMFKEVYKKHGKKLSGLSDDYHALLIDLQTDINIPFVLVWDDRNNEFDLVSKTIMRKKGFKTRDKKFPVRTSSIK